MTEPVTSNKGLIIPNTGDLTGAWGTAALNPDFQLIDAMLGGSTTISLSAATTILLTFAATTGVATSTIPQSANALIRFTGAQSGNAVIQFTTPGFYIVHNKCTGTSYVQLSPASGGGNSIGAIPGRKCQVFFDGTDLDYVDQPDPGAALDLHGATTYLPWMNACTIKPYLIKDGTVYSASVYTALFQLLGSTFGGNGITTFAVPDERARVRAGLDVNINTAYAARLTVAGSGISGTTMGAAGGSEFLQQHNHTYTDPGHQHTLNGNQATVYQGGAGASGLAAAGTSATQTATIGITISSTGSGSSQNVPPLIVNFLPLIKT